MSTDAEPRPTPWSTMGFLLKLLAGVAAPVALVGVMLWWFVEDTHVSGAVADRSVVVTDLLSVALDGELTAVGAQRVDAPQPVRIDENIARLLPPVLGDDLTVRVVGLDGVVAFSTTAAEIGQPVGMSEISPKALRGVPSGRRSDGPGAAEIVQYSLPVAIDGATRAAATVTIADDLAIRAAVDRAADLRAGIAIAMLVMIALVTPLSWRSLGQVRRQFRKTRVLAMNDQLTGLANRTQFHQRLDEAIAAGDRAGDRVGLVLLDLDGFKAINDRGGHAAGDRLLKRVAAALADATRRNEVACRVGGDEFAVIAPRIESHDELVALADRLHKRVDLKVDFSDGRKLRVTASLGLAMFPDDAQNTDDLLNVADVGMYRVKASRKSKLAGQATAGSDAAH